MPRRLAALVPVVVVAVAGAVVAAVTGCPGRGGRAVDPHDRTADRAAAAPDAGVVAVASPPSPPSVDAAVPDAAVPDAAAALDADLGLRVGDALPLAGAIEFDYDRSRLRPSAFPILDAVAAFLLAHPSLVRIEIQGHLAADPDRHAYGHRLSQDRATAVSDYLRAQGVAADRLEAVGYEDSRPVASNATAEGRRANRRIELRVLEIR
ncbi:MAG: OmpA family protein [Kofleriaceae bacterium]|nr:OmpA family protein [Kofleriaceae bacterium]MCB9570475.1 OmpA family protein [Kofleriaceae bacterium]